MARAPPGEWYDVTHDRRNGRSQVPEAFIEQAAWCNRLGSPFTALVCRILGETLNPATAAGRAILHWPGDPQPSADSVPLRVCGALHALARSGRHPQLSSFYRELSTDSAELARILEPILQSSSDVILQYLGRPPQTNEVGRSAAVMAGLLQVHARFRLPMALYELGASAGLNLIPDKYAYQFGSMRYGTTSRLQLTPAWRGASPPASSELEVVSRHGVDIAPIQLELAEHRERLMSYVWPDQRERLDRLSDAIELARAADVRVEQGDAAIWLPHQLASPHPRGTSRVIFHTIFWSYVAPDARATLSDAIGRAAAQATESSPLAWLRYELEPSMPVALRLSTWPGEVDQLLARGSPHGSALEWMAD